MGYGLTAKKEYKMLIKVPREKIESYEEDWQRFFYLIGGDRTNYFQHCEMCFVDKEVERIPGGHYVCGRCFKKLKLLKEDTIMKRATAQLRLAEAPFHLKKIDVTEPSKIERQKAWIKIIKCDYNIDVFNKIKDKI